MTATMAQKRLRARPDAMRSASTRLNQLVPMLSMLLLISIATLIFFLAAGDMFIASLSHKSALVRHFPYSSSKETNETAFFRQSFAHSDLRKGVLEAKLETEHAFSCIETEAGTRCIFRMRGALNCLRSIDISLRYATDGQLYMATGRTIMGCWK